MNTNQTSYKFWSKLVPYLLTGVFIFFAICSIIFISSLLFWGAFIGLILLGIDYIKAKFTRNKQQNTQRIRIIEHDDLD